MTRTRFWARPSAPASSLRNPCGACVVAHIVRPPVAGSGAASVARPSIGTPHRRWLIIRWRTTRWARANTASGSPPVMRFSCSMFLGASSWIWGAPSAIAANCSLTAASGSHSTTTSSTASRATDSDSATMAATASPTYRTRSSESARCARLGAAVAAPPSPPPPSGSGAQRPSMSRPVKTARTPGRRSAAAASMRRIRA